MAEIIRAERVDFQIAPGIFIEFYRLPDGEKRIGVTSASIVCGHTRNYLTELADKSPNRLKLLQGKGFEGSRKSVSIERISVGSKGASRSETLSLEDFRAFVRFSAFDLQKPPAMAIADALMGVAIETIAKQAFGEAGLSLAEIRAMICTQYAKTIDWLEEDRTDAEDIESHQIFIQRGYWPA